MTELALGLVSATVGAMLFFGAIVAPTAFRTLGEQGAGPFVRALFPKYYLVFAVTSGSGAVAAFAAGAPVSVFGLLLVAADLLYHKHVHYAWEKWIGFYGLFGFIASIGLVILAAVIGIVFVVLLILEIVGVIEYVRDISDRQRAERAVRESETRSKALLDALSFSVAVLMVSLVLITLIAALPCILFFWLAQRFTWHRLWIYLVSGALAAQFAIPVMTQLLPELFNLPHGVSAALHYLQLASMFGGCGVFMGVVFWWRSGRHLR